MKKTMKRSLALGALMAFVITGSAMAAELTSGEVTETILGNNTLKDSVVELTSSNKSPIIGDKNKEKTTVQVTDGQTLKIESDAADQTLEGIVRNTNITGNGVVVLINNYASENTTILGTAYSNDKGVNITADTVILESKGRAIYTSGYGTTHNINGRVVKITAADTAIYAADGTVNINASESLVINSTEKKLAIRGNGKGEVNVQSAEGVKADIVINGDVDYLSGGVVNVKLETGKSQLNGAIRPYKPEYDGTANLTLSNGATWNVTGDSTVSNLTGEGANIVIDNLETNINIKENANKDVNIQSTGALSDENADNIKDLMDTLADNVKIDAGVTDKTVTAGEGLIVGETSAKYKGNMMVDGSLKEKENTVNGAISDAGAIGLMTWRNEMNDMNKRMGELRGNEAEHGVWVRMINGELEYEGLENDTKSYQLGYDEKLSSDPRWTVGVSLNYTEGDTSGDKVSAENDHKGFAVYGSKLNEDGSYLDLIAKYARLDHEFTVRGGDKGEWNANGYSVSAEYGKRFTQESGLWYEPQVELTYGRVGAADYKVGGRFVEQDKMDSLVGRVGFRVGKDTAKGNVYARASYLYDFDGETSVTFSDGAKATRTIEQDLGGGWFEVGIGANYKLSDATNLYLDVEKTFGGEVDVNWQWNAGVRYSF